MADLSTYYGRQNLTVEFWAKPAAADIGTTHGLVCLGPSAGHAASDHTFAVSMDDTGDYGAGTNVYTGGARLSTAAGVNAERVESASGVQSTAAQHLAFRQRSGQLPSLTINAMPTAPTFVGQADPDVVPASQSGVALTGTTQAPTSGGLRLGSGPVGSASGTYRGQLAELRVYPSYRSDAVLAAEVLSYSDPDGFMGHSTFDTANAGNQGPVAMPVTAIVTQGGTPTIPVLPSTYDPDGNALTITSRTSGTHGTTTIRCPYTSGGTYQVLFGDTITGATSGATAVIVAVNLNNGSWAAGTAAGTLRWSTQTGVFTAENINVGVNTNVATIDPASGSLRYDHDGTSTPLTDSFTYTVSDGSLTSSAKVSVTIQLASTDPEIPVATRTFTVNGDANLTSYLAGTGTFGARAAGDMALLSGTFNTKRTLSLVGTAPLPYIFKAASLGGAIVNGEWTIAGSFQLVWGLKVTRNPAGPQALAVNNNIGRIIFGGTSNILRRCEFTDWDAPWVLSISAGSLGIVDYCTWHDPMDWTAQEKNAALTAAQRVRYLNTDPNTLATQPLRMGVRTGESVSGGLATVASWHKDFRFRRNHCYDMIDKPIPSVYDSGGSDWIEVGQDGATFAAHISATTTGTGHDLRVPVGGLTAWFNSSGGGTLHTYEYLLLERHLEGAGSAISAAVIDLKAPNVTVKKVTMIDCPGRIDMRWGPKHVWEDIVLRNSGGSWLQGYGSTISRVNMVAGLNRTPSLSFEQGQTFSCAATSGTHQATQAFTTTQVQGGSIVVGGADNGTAIKAYDHAFTRCGTVVVGADATRANCTQDGLAANTNPTECVIGDVGVNAAWHEGEYPPIVQGWLSGCSTKNTTLAEIGRLGTWRGKTIGCIQLETAVHHVSWASMDTHFSAGLLNGVTFAAWIDSICDLNAVPIINLPTRTTMDDNANITLQTEVDSFAEIAAASPAVSAGGAANTMYANIAAAADVIGAALNGRLGYLRFGWEPTEFEWGPQFSNNWANIATQNLSDYQDAWANLSDIFKSRIGANVKAVWNQQKDWDKAPYTALSAGTFPWRLPALWPGDTKVDIVTIDYYDSNPMKAVDGFTPGQSGYTYVLSGATTPNYSTFATKMNRIHDWASLKGKKFGVDEWGLRDVANTGGADNLLFIRGMYDYLTSKGAIVDHESFYAAIDTLPLGSVAPSICHAMFWDNGATQPNGPWTGPSVNVHSGFTGHYVGSQGAGATGQAAAEYGRKFGTRP